MSVRPSKTLIRLGGRRTDLSPRWAHSHIVGFVMSFRLIWRNKKLNFAILIEEKGILFCTYNNVIALHILYHK